MTERINEREFLDHYHRSAFKSVQKASIIGLIIFDLHVFWDYFQVYEHYKLFWAIRLGLVTPIIILMMRLISTDFGRKHLRTITLITSLLAATSVMTFHFISYPSELPTQGSGILLIMLFCLTSLRMLLPEAITFSICCAAAMCFMLYTRDSSMLVWISNIVNILVSSSIGIAATMLMEGYARRAYRDEKSIREEQAKAERLLENTFPMEIAYRLKSGQSTIADYSDNVTVMFADLVGFTKISSKMSPEDLVQNLDEIFSLFDRLTAQYGCEKIKTIGDAYMAVCGVPHHDTNHAERIVRLALGMQRAAKKMTLHGVPLSLRIGIHSGPVVAGVIGKSRFAYDLWGDTVNTASRMESTAQANTIQVSATTIEQITGKFSVQKRGPIEIKGKGMMETWVINIDDDENSEYQFLEQVS